LERANEAEEGSTNSDFGVNNFIPTAKMQQATALPGGESKPIVLLFVQQRCKNTDQFSPDIAKVFLSTADLPIQLLSRTRQVTIQEGVSQCLL
jgi:hypothetical protein